MPLGIPRSDIERAVNHYGITEAQYCANPDAYPLPARGSGLTTGEASGSGLGWLVVALVALLLLGGRKQKAQ